MEISKRYSSFMDQTFSKFPVTVLTKVTYRNFEISNLIFSSAWLCQQSLLWRGADVHHHPSVKQVFWETIKKSNATYCGKAAVHRISKPFFPFFKILDCWILTNFFFIFINMGPYGSENFKMVLLPHARSYNSFSTKLFFYLFPVTVLTKLSDRNFDISI